MPARRTTKRHFNPLPPRGGRPFRPDAPFAESKISIHSLLAEGDIAQSARHWSGILISIHSLLAEGDVRLASQCAHRQEFQSTPSSRRETGLRHALPAGRNHFNPLPPRGGRQDALAVFGNACGFQSTPSSRRETSRSSAVCRAEYDFNPLPPRGGRRWFLPSRRPSRRFQSTPSSRRETGAKAAKIRKYVDFNPLPPRGGRPARRMRFRAQLHFNPLPPRGGRLRKHVRAHQHCHFNPLPPRGGRRALCHARPLRGAISIHSLLAEGDNIAFSKCNADAISIHSLLAEGDIHDPRARRRD